MVDQIENMWSLGVGDPKTAVIGPLSSFDHRAKVENYVAIAKEEGGKILIGGERPTHLEAPFDKGAFFMPTIIDELPYTSLTRSFILHFYRQKNANRKKV